MVADICETVRT